MRAIDEDVEVRTSMKDWSVPQKKLQPRTHEPIPRGVEYGIEPMTSVQAFIPEKQAGDQETSPW